MNTLPDIQVTKDERDVFINQVGVTNVTVPVRFKVPDGNDVRTTGNFEMSVSLPPEVKGTHMSRFTEVLNGALDTDSYFDSVSLRKLGNKLLIVLNAPSARVSLAAKYFMPQAAPSSNKMGIAPFDVKLTSHVSSVDNGNMDLLEVSIYGKTCCPCSRLISGYDEATGTGKGAHSQRGLLTMELRTKPNQFVWFEDLFEIASKSFSSPVYPILKRPDEKHVTEGAYGNPKFVEDVLRDAVVELRKLEGVASFKVRVENDESIHYHNAFATFVS